MPALHTARRHMGTSGRGTVEPELIAIETIEVEVIPAASHGHNGHLHNTSSHYSYHDAASGGGTAAFSSTAAEHLGGGNNGNNNAKASSSSSSGAAAAAAPVMEEAWHRELHGLSYWDVDKVDPFARSRVTNFVRRAGGNASTAIFEVRRTEVAAPGGGGGGRVAFIASCRLVLPEPHRSFVAEGTAEGAKDAELLAAMHAERVCDALGVPLFRLPSMQRRHAEAARAEGRYAPMPGDPVRPDGTPVPPPLRMVAGITRSSSGAALANGCDGGHFHATTTTTTPAKGWHGGTPPALAYNHQPQQQQGGDHHGKAPPQHNHRDARLFTSAVAEAEIVEPLVESGNNGGGGGRSALGAARAGSLFCGGHSPSGGAEAVSDGESSRHHSLAWLPWTDTSHRGNSDINGNIATAASPSAATIISSAAAEAAATFDPTEKGLWLMVNTASTRCSPAPADALVLPCVYEPAALERLKDYVLQHRLSLAERTAVASVAVSGSATRMYVVELRLVAVPHTDTNSGGGGVVTASGKAQTVEVATVLAAMHAELLLDALGLPLFPLDATRQARHARAARGFGRWAPDPLARGGEESAGGPDPYAPLPLPLKQQVGSDDVWLDPAMMARANAYPRSDGERVIAAMNNLNYFCGDCVEANPPQEWLDEAVDLLRQWQVSVARNPFPELYVVTVMGDYFRATTLTPVPRHFGVRGGNAIGRSVEQAVQLCALHAIDGLCALGVPLFADPAEQRRFLWRRRRCGLVTVDDMRGMTRPKGLVCVLKPSIVLSGGATPEVGTTTTTMDDDSNGACAEEEDDNDSGGGYGGGGPARAMRAYLPGYLIEGSARRLPPHIADTLAILQLSIPGDFAVCGASGVPMGPAAAPPPPPPTSSSSSPSTASPPASVAELLQSLGNDTKTCVQNYLRQQHSLQQQQRLMRGHTATPTISSSRDNETEEEGGGCPLDAAALAELERQLQQCPPSLVPAVYITGYGKQVSVHNIAYLRLPPPLTTLTINADSSGSGVRPTAVLAETKRAKKRRLQRACADPSASLNAAVVDDAAPVESTTASTPAPPTAAAAAPLLAVGISLKKKDAERACFLHAAALLQHHHGEDVLRTHRAGLPRQGSTQSFQEVEEKLLPAGYFPPLPPPAHTASDNSSGKSAAGPKPLMNFLMKQFMESGRHFTAPRKRPTQHPHSPFRSF